MCPDFCWCLPILKGCSLAEVRASRLGLTSHAYWGTPQGSLPPDRYLFRCHFLIEAHPVCPTSNVSMRLYAAPCPELSFLSLLPVPVLVIMSYMFCLVVFRGEEAEECHVHSNHRAVPDGTGADPGGLPQHLK